MRFEYFILSPLLCYSAKEDKESCLGRCGIIYDKNLPCQCNTACNTYGDCCKDYDDSCPKVIESSTSNHINSVATFITSEIHSESTSISTAPLSTDAEFHDDSTSTSTLLLRKDTVKTGTERSSSGIIAGVAVSLTVVMFIVVLILVLVFRKIHLRKQLLSQTVGNGNRTSKMNYYATEYVQEDQYHEIDISDGDYCLAAAVSNDTGNFDGTKDGDATYVRAISGVYNKLNEKDNRTIENASKLERIKMEMYTLPLISQLINKQRLKYTCDVNLLFKLSIIFQEWRVIFYCSSSFIRTFCPLDISMGTFLKSVHPWK